MERSFDPTVFTKKQEEASGTRVWQGLFDVVVLEVARQGLLSDECFKRGRDSYPQVKIRSCYSRECLSRPMASLRN